MTEALALQQEGGLLAQDEVLSPVMSLELAKKRLVEFQSFVREYLREGEDFGTIPGTPKPTLYKPGADKLCELYGLSDDYEIVDKVEDFSMIPALFDYTIRCRLTRIRTQLAVSTGLGSCNSYEGRYRWREGKRSCPECHAESIIKGKEEYGGGWLCYAKKGGCGAKFSDDDQKIVGQFVGRIENDDIATLKNTILKMAKKRAKVDATLAATRSSGIFTQDIEDISDSSEPPAKKAAPAQKANAPRSSVKCSECKAEGGHLPSCSKRTGGVQASPKLDEQAQAPAKDEGPTICSECRKVNGHDESCKYYVKPQNVALYSVKSFERKQKKATKGKEGAEYLVLAVVNQDGADGKLYIWHTSIFEYFTAAKYPATLLAEVSKQETQDKKAFYSVEHILELAGRKFVADKPVDAQAEMSTDDEVEQELFGEQA